MWGKDGWGSSEDEGEVMPMDVGLFVLWHIAGAEADVLVDPLTKVSLQNRNVVLCSVM